MSRLSRRSVVLAALALAAVVLMASAAPWVTAVTTSPLTAAVPITVNGHDASPLVTAGALVAAAAALALTLGGRVAARVAGGGIMLGGALVLVSAVTVLVDPGTSAASAARSAVGVAALTEGPNVGVAAHVAWVLGAALVLVGLAGVVAAGRWSSSDSRHRRPDESPAAGPEPSRPDDRDVWDALSRGEDPT